MIFSQFYCFLILYYEISILQDTPLCVLALDQYTSRICKLLIGKLKHLLIYFPTCTSNVQKVIKILLTFIKKTVKLTRLKYQTEI